ncbi:radical SAM family heme chaperone HemW [Caldichromatium japonicum]|uniref:Heme chaperone HemW n=2 Tax=Caldichromatium japonicum TaxID=2699430 RepID=A0A6G7VGN2_9GAMM|nr:radical SAM family heme chaperone HemW [Caldichromatium japonicum]
MHLVEPCACPFADQAGSVNTHHLELPPLGLYIHLPWCIRKCPYCDFNSYPTSELPFAAYSERLLADLEQELSAPAAQRPIQTVFIGGGTPSLFPGWAIRRLLDGVRSRSELAADAEITLESNPGTLDPQRLDDYRAAGVNRLSLGVQSLSAKHLRQLRRIHGPEEARAAVQMARAAGFTNINLDLMFGLPEQDLAQARADLDEALALVPEHLSYYQLTLEPGTVFGTRPPVLPDPDLIAEMGWAGAEYLETSGYRRYEVSAYARPGYICRHNLNYWQFGDYLGIGAGAHGKLTTCPQDPAHPWQIWRTEKPRHPRLYLRTSPAWPQVRRRLLTDEDLVVEFALNALRLTQGFAIGLFAARTGRPGSWITAKLTTAAQKGLVQIGHGRIEPTPRGYDLLDSLLLDLIETEI